MKTSLLLFLLASTVARHAVSQSTNGLMDHLIGRWVLSGTLAGKQTTHDVSAEWVLNRDYVQVHEISREKTTSGAPAYEAMVFISFNSASNEYSILWLDSTASSSFAPEDAGHAKLSKDPATAIPFLFKDSAGHITFENTFVYDEKSDSWEWIMANVKDGEKKPFGRVRLVRARSA